MSKIRIENLYKVFGHSPERAIPMLQKGMTKDEIFKESKLTVGVNDASFDVNQGEIVVVMGLSGSGKSTLVRCINRLIEPTYGKIIIDGEDVTALDSQALRMLRQKKLGMVFQNFALFPHRTVRQNAAYGLEIQGVDLDQRNEMADNALAQVGLAGWEDALPGQLSGGMQQRVGLARALALDPDILLMDEAFSALDPLIRRDMQDELIGLQQKMRKTIVFISHDLDEALKLGDRIVLMKDGAIVQVGSPEDILTQPSTEYVARFVEEVDITKVLYAESVMKKVHDVVYLDQDGPRTALRKMKKAGLSSLFVLGPEHKYQGIISAEECARLVEEGTRDLRKILCTDCKTVPPDLPAQDLIQILHDLPHPLPVVDEEGFLKGVIVRGTLLGAIAERGRAVEKVEDESAAPAA
ncbi:glycine/betaine ABC transporter ATP-binding protein [Oceanidesulfovibrio indonesiensis]|uniref:Glycine/betaine ABC transporter ATP-binding protein n=1 Tax=Oceanidesulfovibrio indonesiensis TaxID=54767 RepID=A0A7M3MIB1_9BACT|nr:glycine betaine/L-proline ABC transporter ATP-binding protein [Oceanidesulfovibrio indonesiensis]TVM19359.1 glycine/betaine ABC transporter ATP-binding protein [Oceanidesulfovibrio indonesiensis]